MCLHVQHCEQPRGAVRQTAPGDEQGRDKDCVSRGGGEGLLPAPGR